MKLSLLYRGLLTSCNYACHYCPFAKRTESDDRQRADREALARFSRWVADAIGHTWRILFTPWGEALVRSWYRDAVVSLTHAANVESVTIQTNLSCGLSWVEACCRERLAFWATFHPTETDRGAFVRKVMRLREQNIRLSVGMVGVPAFFEQMAALRRELPADVYMWINAQQPRPRPYTDDERSFLCTIDPLFDLVAQPRRSLGRACRAGQNVFTVDGKGDMRRCHFVDEVIGNIYQPAWEQALQSRACPNRWCHCFLGKVQLDAETFDRFFGGQALERLPAFEGLQSDPTVGR